MNCKVGDLPRVSLPEPGHAPRPDASPPPGLLHARRASAWDALAAPPMRLAPATPGADRAASFAPRNTEGLSMTPTPPQSPTDAAVTAFQEAGLPFPPVPPDLAAQLRQCGPHWYATRPVDRSPYDLASFLSPDVSATPFALVGFDGHGVNSHAVHYYLVRPSLALYVQLPWGGVYLDHEEAKREIEELFTWAQQLQAGMEAADDQGRLAPRRRLEVMASRFRDAGWRWNDTGGTADGTPWRPASGMLDAILKEVDALKGA